MAMLTEDHFAQLCRAFSFDLSVDTEPLCDYERALYRASFVLVMSRSDLLS